MLVVISDLHLTDGTSGETIRAGAFRVFRERLCNMAYDASWRSDGKYRPIEEMHIVLLGDILDLIRSTKWPASKTDPGYVRPWHDPQSKLFISKIRAISDAILRHNADSLAILRSLGDGKTITVPPATHDGKPAIVSREPDAPERSPVKVHSHYLIGNHDWFLHLPGESYDQIRQGVIRALGLVNPSQGPFPHDPGEYPEIEAVFRQHKVFARHGDIFDPFNYEGNRDASSLGDAIVVDLVNRFSTEVKMNLGAMVPAECIAGLKEIDNVRPMLLIPVWIDGLVRRTCQDAGQIKGVKEVWDGLVDDFLGIDFVRQRDSALNPLDSVDKLEWALKFSRGVSFELISRVVLWVKEKMKGTSTYYPNALTENAFKNRTAQFIVYGHTHHHEIKPLDVSYVGGRLFNQIYLNSGTWRQVHDQALSNPALQEFVGYKVMTFLAFFKDDERGGRSLEAWSGTLSA